jgi:hypothetical protein
MTCSRLKGIFQPTNGIDDPKIKMWNRFMNMKQLLRNFTSVSFAFSLISCSHPREQFKTDLAKKNCDLASSHLPEEDPLALSAEYAKRIGGNIAAYTYTAGGYTAEVLWDITAGTIIVVAVAAPIVALGVLCSKNNCDVSGRNYMPVVPTSSNSPQKKKSFNLFKVLEAPPLGRRAFRQTQELRCPNLKDVSKSLRQVASCYESNGDKQSLSKAIVSLENIEKSEVFFTCLPQEEREAVTTQKNKLQSQLTVMESSI